MNRADWCYVSGWVSAQWERFLRRADFLMLLRAAADERRARLRMTLLYEASPPVEPTAESVMRQFAAAVRRVAYLSPNPRLADLFLQSGEWEEFRRVAKVMVGRTAPVGSEVSIPERLRAIWSGAAGEPALRPFVLAASVIARNAPRDGECEAWVDRVVDAHEIAALVSVADDLLSDVLREWVGTWARQRAAVALFRARKLGWNVPDFWPHWQRVGFDDPLLAAVALGPDSELPAALRGLGWREPEKALAEPEPAVHLGRQMEAQVEALASAARGIPFGPEPVFAFLWVLRREALDLRLVLSAVGAGMSEESVAAVLRATHD